MRVNAAVARDRPVNSAAALVVIPAARGPGKWPSMLLGCGLIRRWDGPAMNRWPQLTVTLRVTVLDPKALVAVRLTV
jgi:hypothetical protein